jgi:hypothetical protein
MGRDPLQVQWCERDGAQRRLADALLLSFFMERPANQTPHVSFVMGLAPSASVLLAYSPDGNVANAERAEKAVQNLICHRIQEDHKGPRRLNTLPHCNLCRVAFVHSCSGR